MPHWLRQHWEGSRSAEVSRSDGVFHAYCPDGLGGRPIALPARLGKRAGQVERAIRELGTGPDVAVLDGVGRLLPRSEAIASSRMDGLPVSPREVAIAAYSRSDEVGLAGVTQTALLIADDIMQDATAELATAENIAVENIEALHRAFVSSKAHHGLRTRQSWIGGGTTSPLDADFVPPPPRLVRPLMEDLAAYIDNAVPGPLVHAALVHAQFESIHPFADGNGRVGRALVHTVLERRGLTRNSALPISLALLERSDDYVRGLTAYQRVEGSDGDIAPFEGLATWVEVFVEAAAAAVEKARTFAERFSVLVTEWERRLLSSRTARGVRERPRSTSGVARLLETLPTRPVVTTRTVQRILGVSFPSARAALEELASAGIVSRQHLDNRTTGYVAAEVLRLLPIPDRHLPGTRWDTHTPRPSVPTPSRSDAGAPRGADVE